LAYRVCPISHEASSFHFLQTLLNKSCLDLNLYFGENNGVYVTVPWDLLGSESHFTNLDPSIPSIATGDK
jgi:hypothetical protein